MRSFRRDAGFVPAAFMELMILTTIAAVVAAVSVPFFLRLRAAGKTHECAIRLDARAAQPVSTEAADAASATPDTCPISGVRFVIDGAGETARFCCPTPQRHEKLDELCRAADGPVLATVHRKPKLVGLVLSGIVAGGSSLVVALALGLSLVLTIADAFRK
jgi:hypothetical protein